MKIPTPDEFTKAGGYRPFPGKWNRWLNAVREEILSAQPVAGRHVTIDEHPGKGTVINADDTSARRAGGGGGPPHGCADCALPDGDCRHAVCFEVNFDAEDISTQNLFDLGSDLGMWRDADGTFNAFGWDGNDSISLPLNPGVWNCIVFKASSDGVTGTVDWSVNGTESSFTSALYPTEDDTIDFGAKSGTPGAHRSFRNIHLLANPSTAEDDFNFPPDSFDSFTGGASIVGGELRIDDDSGDAYALKNFDPSYDSSCYVAACCHDGTCDDTTQSDCDVLGGDWMDTGCSDNPCLGACCSDPRCFIMTKAQCDAVPGGYQGIGTVCDPSPCCQGGTYSVSATASLGFSGATGPCTVRSFSGTSSPFSGSITSGTPVTIPGDCLCFGTDCDDSYPSCGDNFGPNCFHDTCVYTQNCPDPGGDPPDCPCPNPDETDIVCVGAGAVFEIRCFDSGFGDENGWYFSGSTGAGDFCGGELGWATSGGTSPLGTEYIKFASIPDGPTGSFSFPLTPDFGGSATIGLSIS